MSVAMMMELSAKYVTHFVAGRTLFLTKVANFARIVIEIVSDKVKEATMKDKRTLAHKLARPDGWDFYTGKTINYRENIGKIVKPPLPNPELGLCSSGVLHASKNPNDCFVGAQIPCSAYRVSGIPVCGDSQKQGFTSLKVIREITEITELDNLFGWKYSEVINPIHPLKLPFVSKPSDKHLELLKNWAAVWNSVWDSVWNSIGAVGTSVRNSVWNSVWNSSVRDSVWNSIKISVRDSIWTLVWAYIGSLFPKVNEWRYVKKINGIYPFQSAMDLWKQGIVPSFDGKLWRLHSGIKAEIIWEGEFKK